ncbi:MAG: hypothetical protein H7Z72_03020 [Bacteroidetes bacterium]|nr:hypothetical protein [Fibrella sp.]
MRIGYLMLVILAVSWKALAANSLAGESKAVTIAFDFESAQAVITLLGQKHVSEEELTSTARLAGNQQLIRKVASYATSADEVFFKRTLKELIETGTVEGRDLYDWKTVKANRAAIQRMLAQLARQKQSFSNEVVGLISAYSPADMHATIRACVLVGGGSLGFTFDNDNTFYVALQKVGDDYEGLKYLVVHELYHSIQTVGETKRRANLTAVKPPDNIGRAYVLLDNLWLEGSATLVGDPSDVPHPKPFLKEQQDEYVKNRNRRSGNAALFESLLFQAYADSAADVNRLYGIAFSTDFDETSYYVGYEMAKAIEQYEGKRPLRILSATAPSTSHYNT